MTTMAPHTGIPQVIVPTQRFSRPGKAAPEPARKLVIASGKGGVGKSQLAREIAFGAALGGLATLLLEVEMNHRLLHTVTGISTYAGQTVDNNSTIWGVITKPKLVEGLQPFQIDTRELLTRAGFGRLSVAERREYSARWRWQTPQVLEYIPGSPSMWMLDSPTILSSASEHRMDFDPAMQLTRGVNALAQHYDLIVMETP